MNFKCALILVAVAFCAVQAASFDDHERNRRSAADLFDKAKDFVSNLKDKIKTGAKDALTKITSAFNNIEEKLVKTTTGILSKVGINVDVQGLINTLKGNIKACALSADVKSKALAVKDDLLSCVSSEVADIQTIIKEITDVATTAKDAPAVIQNAVSVCKGQSGESFSFTRVLDCAKALKSVTEEESLVTGSEAIVKNVKKALEIAQSIQANGAGCLVNKVKSAGSTVVDVAKNVAQCIATSG